MPAAKRTAKKAAPKPAAKPKPRTAAVPPPQVGVTSESTGTLRVRRPTAKRVAKEVRKAGADPARDLITEVAADELLSPLLARASLDAKRWGSLAAVAPAEALLQEVQRTQALILWIEDLLREYGGIRTALEPIPLDEHEWQLLVAKRRDRNYDKSADVQAWYTADVHRLCSMGERVRRLNFYYTEARAHLIGVARASDAARLAERTVTIREHQAKMMAALIGRVHGDARLALTEAQLKILPMLMREALTMQGLIEKAGG